MSTLSLDFFPGLRPRLLATGGGVVVVLSFISCACSYNTIIPTSRLYYNIIMLTSRMADVERYETRVFYHLNEIVEILSVHERFLEIHIAVDVCRGLLVFNSNNYVLNSEIENPRMTNVQCL